MTGPVATAFRGRIELADYAGMTVEILTFGCRLNTYESEVMRATPPPLQNTIIVNTCAVTAEAERQARQASAAPTGKTPAPASW